jgi:hypothetical protein
MYAAAERRAPAMASGHGGQAAPSATEREWLAYFDALVDASHAVLDVPAGDAAGTADVAEAPLMAFPVVTPPTLPMPAALEHRRADVVTLLDRTAHEIERRQAQVARELAGLGFRSTRSAYHAEAGDVLDLVG